MSQESESKPIKYFLYCRKSTDSEDRQVLSLDGQVEELKELAKWEHLKIIDTYRESHSAHHPGRPKFNEMLARIERGEANGILVWATNRIARNSMDGGKFIYMMDQGKIVVLKTKGATYYNTPEHKFTLNIDFSVAKKSSDDLGVVVMRGNRSKLKIGGWPGAAKPGYMNITDKLTRRNKIDVDTERFPLLQQAMKLIIDGTHTPMEVLDKLIHEWHYTTTPKGKLGGRPLQKSAFYRILKDPYYYGLMIFGGKEYMGNHKPMISEEEYDRLQLRLGGKGKPHHAKHDFPYKGVLKCGECGGSITCEEKRQIICSICKRKFHQKKGLSHCPGCKTDIQNIKGKQLHYIYYRCTKKKHPECKQPSVSINVIEKKIDEELKKFEIPEVFKDWAIKHLNEINDRDEKNEMEVNKHLLTRLQEINTSLRNLLKLRISGRLGEYDEEQKALYDAEEKALMMQKKEIKEQIDQSDKRQEKWIKLTKESFEFACYARYWFAHGDVKTKTQILGKLGNNLVIRNKNLLLDKDKAYFLIEKGKQEVEEKVQKLEPNPGVITPIQMLSHEEISSTWLGDLDSDQDKRIQSPLSYR